jgi:uncharacterized membrane protein YraQ (UPF0718 family)
MDYILMLLKGGWDALIEYLSFHVLTCLIPALFIAGAIAVFISQAAVLKYFGPKANKFFAYGIASVSGTILAVCSCTVLPLFGGIYLNGAGIGPATAFLYSGPAINILAIVYSARLLGYDIGLARVIGAVFFSVFIGLMMAIIFRKEERQKNATAFEMLLADPEAKPLWKQIIFFAVLVGILVLAASKQWLATGILLVALGIILWRWFNTGELKQWMLETWRFFRPIIPWLLVGVFIAGMLKVIIPEAVVTQYVGGNTLQGNFIASFLGMFMYFATLTEVPVIRAFMDLGMDKGPALALLLAGPAVSLPSILTLRGIMGWKKTLTYAGLVVITATTTGYIFGLLSR